MAGTPKMWTAINQSVGDGSPQRIETRTRAYEDEMLGYATDPNLPNASPRSRSSPC